MNRALLIAGDPSLTSRPARRRAAEELIEQAALPFRAPREGEQAVVLSADEPHYPDSYVLAMVVRHRMDARLYGLDGVIRRARIADEKRFAPGAVSPSAVLDTMLVALAALRERGWNTRAIALCSVEHDYPECLAKLVTQRAREVYGLDADFLRCEAA